MPSLALTLGLAAVGTAVVYGGSGLLETAAERLSSYHGLPPVVHGAVVVAVGSSFPELSSAVLATLLHGSFDLGVGAIVGSAIFNILVIPAASGLADPDPLASNKELVYKESLFYMLSVAVLLLTFALAVIYNPAPGGQLLGAVTRPLALIPVALYALYVWVQWEETADHEAGPPPEDVSPWRERGRLLASLVLILAGVEALVRAAVDMGAILGTPSFVWGLTVVAAGTSLPDAIVSVRAARAGEGVTSLGNVLGSNIFDLTIAVPAGIIVAGSAPVDFAAAVPMMAILVFATLLLFGLMRTELEVTAREAAVLLGAYSVFVALVVADALKLLDVFPAA